MNTPFRTIVKPKPPPFRVGYADALFLIGSCFAENIGSRFQSGFFHALINPFGVMYNPTSTALTLHRILDRKLFVAADLSFHRLWHSFELHGSFSASEPETVVEHANAKISEAHTHLKKSAVLIVTWGTSWIYEHAHSGKPVANCHRYPQATFNRRRLDVEEIVTQWNKLIDRLQLEIPELKIIFTISPVRHWKDGAHENQLSKATLLMAVEKLCNAHSHCHYFEAFELQMDDLRDYRFYATDMLHPSDEAQNYIFQSFAETLLDHEAQEYLSNGQKIGAMLHHRPLQSVPKEMHNFNNMTIQKINELIHTYPKIPQDVQKNLQEITHRVQKNNNIT